MLNAIIAVLALLTAAPDTAKTVVQNAADGDVITLSPGNYGPATFTGKKNLTINAKGARVQNWQFRDSVGIIINDGLWVNGCVTRPCYAVGITARNVNGFYVNRASFEGPSDFAEGYGFQAFTSQNLQIDTANFARFKMSAGFTKSQNIIVRNISCEDNRSDCLNFAQSQNVLATDINCTGTKITAAEHPDCIQSWSRPDYQPSGNLEFRRVFAKGQTQGVGLFNHKRDYPAGYVLADGTVLTEVTRLDDGGFDNVLIEDVVAYTSQPQTIAASSVRGLTIRNSHVHTLLGAQFRSSLNTANSTIIQKCGNVVWPGAGKPGVIDPPCPLPVDPEASILRGKIDAAKAALQ